MLVIRGQAPAPANNGGRKRSIEGLNFDGINLGSLPIINTVPLDPQSLISRFVRNRMLPSAPDGIVVARE
jgi:hypothetical protein